MGWRRGRVMAAFLRWTQSCILLSSWLWGCGGRLDHEVGSKPPDAAAGAPASATGGAPTVGDCGTVPQRVEAPIEIAPLPGGVQMFAELWSSRNDLVAGVGEHVIYCGSTSALHASGGSCVDLGVPADLLIPDSSPFDDQDPWSAWGSATDDFYFVQWGSVLHYDGRNWAEREELGKPVLEVTGSGPNELWLTDMDHVNWHFVNGALEKIPPYIGSYVTELHGGGPGEVWGIRVSAARSQRDTPRELMHYVRGERWTGTGLVGIVSFSVTSATNAWATDGSFLYHYDGQCWSEFADPASTLEISHAPLRDVWAHRPDDVWLTAGDAHLRHWNGHGWALMSLPTQGALGDIWGTPRGVWVLEEGQDGAGAYYFVPYVG